MTAALLAHESWTVSAFGFPGAGDPHPSVAVAVTATVEGL